MLIVRLPLASVVAVYLDLFQNNDLANNLRLISKLCMIWMSIIIIQCSKCEFRR